MEWYIYSATNTTEEEPLTQLGSNNLKLGPVWLLNRFFAVKAVVDPQKQSMETSYSAMHSIG